MARFLIAVWPFAGHIFPLIAVAHALTARGHAVAFYTGADQHHLVTSEGFEHFPFRHVDERRVHELLFASGA
jgi:UDP:flavonoid glycosyltransferase YjiC (YdhE family)